MKIKVCGMRSPENIAALSRLPIDYMGFIFWEGSSRFVRSSTPELPAHIAKIGVFVDAPTADIHDIAKNHGLQGVQLHGKETAETCQHFQSLGYTVIKAFAVGPSFDFGLLEAYEPHCDYFLFDTKSELPGGSGKQFDWTLLEEYPSKTPFWISGGIGPTDAAAITELQKKNLPLDSIDLNSKFETAPGCKNIELLEGFINQLK